MKTSKIDTLIKKSEKNIKIYWSLRNTLFTKHFMRPIIRLEVQTLRVLRNCRNTRIKLPTVYLNDTDLD